jgi:hypothetical protein
MRVIGFFPIFCFGILLLFPLSLTWYFYKFAESLPVEKTFLMNLFLIGLTLIVFILGMLFIHRLFLIFFKIPEGDILKGSRGEFFLDDFHAFLADVFSSSFSDSHTASSNAYFRI